MFKPVAMGVAAVLAAFAGMQSAAVGQSLPAVPDVGPGVCVANCGGSSSSSGSGSFSSGSGGSATFRVPSGSGSGLGQDFNADDGLDALSDRSSEGGDGEQEKKLKGFFASTAEGSGTDTAAAAPLFSGDGGGVVDPAAISGEFRPSAEAEHRVAWVSPDELPTAEPYRDYSEMGFLQPLKDRVKAGAQDLVKSDTVQRLIALVPQGTALKAIYDEGNSLYEALGEGIVVPMAEKTLGNISGAVEYPVTGNGEAEAEWLVGYADQGGAGEAVQGEVDSLLQEKIQDRVEGPIFEADTPASQYDQSGQVAIEGLQSSEVARANQLGTGQSSADSWSQSLSNLGLQNNFIGKFSLTR